MTRAPALTLTGSGWGRARAAIAPFTLALSGLLLGGCGGDAPSSPLADSAVEDSAREDGGVIDDTAAPDGAHPEDTTVAAPRPGFHTDGDRLIDDRGRALILHAANVSNVSKQAPEHLPWQDADDLQALADAGFNAVRYVMNWAAIMPAPGQIDEAWLDRLAARIEWLSDAGLLVVLDMHQDIFGEGFGHNGAPVWACDQAHYDAYEPTTPWWKNYLSPEVAACFDHLYQDEATWARFVAAWVVVAERFGDDPTVIGFDLLNEPHWGSWDYLTFVPELWQPRQEELAAALHAVAPDTVIFFETPPLLSLALEMDFTPTTSSDVAFAPHYYHPAIHEGGSYSSHMAADIARALDAMSATADSLGGAPSSTPVWIGEIGAAPTLPTFGRYVRELIAQITARGWGWSWWSDDKSDQTFGLRDAEGVLLPEVIAILGHPYARRVPGRLIEQRVDFEAGRFEARWSWDVAAPLELWLGPAPLEVTVTSVDLADPLVACPELTANGHVGVVECPRPEAARAAGAEFKVVLRWAP